jgi:hypothetical protein
MTLTLAATTPTDTLTLRIPYDEPIADAAGLRKATVKLASRARTTLRGVSTAVSRGYARFTFS